MIAAPAPARPVFRDVLNTLLVGAIVTLATYGSVGLTRVEGGVAVVWVVNGLVAGVLLMSPRATWPRWLLVAGIAQVLGRYLLANAPIAVYGLTLANLFEAWLVAWWIRRRTADLRQLDSLPKVSRDAILATLVATALSAFAPVLLVRLPTPPLETWFTWFAAHVLGMVVVATLTVCAFQPNVHLVGRAGRRVDYAVCVGLLVATCAGIFWQTHYPLLFLTYLPLLLLTFRHGLGGMVVGVMVLAVSSGIAAAREGGPFALIDEASQLAHLLLWQVYVAASCLLAYPTAVAIAERRRLAARLRAGEERLNAIADNIPASITYFDTTGTYRYANAVAKRTAGTDRELVGRTLRDVRGDAVHAHLADHVAGVLRGEPQNFDGQTVIEGRLCDFHAQFVPDVDKNGKVVGYYSLALDVTRAKEVERELARMARFDALTGLANRRHFEESIAEAVIRAQRQHHPLMLMSLDVDRFKGINDTYGHAVGDEVLRAFSKRLAETVYDVDLVARMGGDEFLVLVEYTPTAEVGRLVAARVIEAMVAPIVAGEVALVVGVSIGIGVHYPVQSAAQLIALADKALYMAKDRGRNTWAVVEG